MMTHPSTRTELQSYLEGLTGLPETRVLYQPPAGQELKYPCVIYELTDLDQIFASNSNYRNQHCYEIKIISRNPDSKHVKTFSELPKCRFLRHYASDDLNYWVFRFWTNL